MESNRKVPSRLSSIILVHSLRPALKAKGFYADNLAFEHEEFIGHRNAADVYQKLSEPREQTKNEGSIAVVAPTCLCQWIFSRAVLSALLTITILLVYFWIHTHYIHPSIIETFQNDPQAISITSNSRSVIISKKHGRSDNHDLEVPVRNHKSSWRVTYDLPPGIDLIKMSAKEMGGISSIHCPLQKFALALEVESDAELAENWLKECGHNVVYFKMDGNPSADDIDRLIKYVFSSDFLQLKATLKIEKGGNILNNEDFQKTKMSDQIISNVAMSGYITPQTMKELVEIVPYTEELTISGDEICSSLRRSRQASEETYQVKWEILRKLKIMETGECVGMYDLIYSSWDMPNLETVQIRKSSINDANADFIMGILGKYKIKKKVDYADNVCFDNTMINYPFMCQPSEL